MNSFFAKFGVQIALNSAVVAVMSGCSAYTVQLECDSTMNSFEMDPSSAGRLLDVAVIAVADKDLDKLDGVIPGLTFPKKKPEAAKAITAVRWWKEGLSRHVLDTLGPDAVWEKTLAANDRESVTLRPAGSFGKRGGILVLGRYWGYDDVPPPAELKTQEYFGGREASRSITVEVGATRIKRK